MEERLQNVLSHAGVASRRALNPDVRIRVIHAGEGTLWTDLKGASLAVPAKGGK